MSIYRRPPRTSPARIRRSAGLETLERRDLLAVVISEFMADNVGALADADGEYSDWIELHNTGGGAVNLNGWFLTDDDGELNKWALPNVTLPADGYLTVFASNKNRTDPGAELHTNFRLSNNGEYLGLVRSDGATVEFDYAPQFPNQRADLSYGLSPDNVTRGYFINPTPGAANSGEPLENPERAIVISEIMYHLPQFSVTDAENVDEEYIEIYNRGTAAVNLQNWTFSAGIDFTFPNVTVAPGDYLAIAANLASFQAKYPGVTNVVGGWSGKLSNAGEGIELTDNSGVRIDRVEYADSGNWSVRTRGPLDQGHRGWTWSELADGGGHSLELVNFSISNEYGQNWAPSIGTGGTPGRVNSRFVTNTAPLILDIAHDPPIPNSSDQVRITATLLDETTTSLTAMLYWRVDGNATFQSLAMNDNGAGADVRAGDRVFSAFVPAQPNNTVIEFYVGSSDGSMGRTWPAPVESSGLQEANYLYQVSNAFDRNAAWTPNSAGVFYQIMTAAERDEFTNINRLSDAQMNATFISVTGTGIDVVYNAGVRIRGSASRFAAVPNNRINFPTDAPWHGLTAVNLNTDTVVEQIAGGILSQLAGLQAGTTQPAVMYSNNVNLMGGTTVYNYLEALNSEWADNHFPGNSGGNLYKGRRSNESPNGGLGAGLQYFGTDVADYLSYTKLTNEGDADWSDVIVLTDLLNNTPDNIYPETIEAIVDVDQWLRTLAFHAIIDNTEGGLFIGDTQGDDYVMYRGDVDGKFYFVTHDLDTLFGSTTRSFTRFTSVSALNRMYNTFRDRYYDQLRDLSATLTSDNTFAIFDRTMGSFTAAGNINNIKQFLVNRTDYILSQIPAAAATGERDELDESRGPQTGALPVPVVRLNEVLAINQSTLFATSSTPDLIELYNGGAVAVDLSDMSMSDSAGNPRKFIFPAGSVIGPGSYLVLVADANPDDQYLHLGFSLDGNGEGISLYDKLSSGGVLVDSVTFGLQIADYSIGRDTAGTWTLGTPTLGKANAEVTLASISNVSINEWMASESAAASEDFVELYNDGTNPVDLSGAYLSDNPNWEPAKSQIAPLSFVAAKGFARLLADGNSGSGANHVAFRLSADQDMVALFDRDLHEIDRALFIWQVTDISEGRSPDGANSIVGFAFPTPGLANVSDSSVVTNMLGYNATWHYDDSGTDRGEAWREVAYNDSAWQQGVAPFGVETSPIPVPLVTPLVQGPSTHYFRTQFTLDEDPSLAEYQLTAMIDDGMLVYINGIQVLNLGMPSSGVTYDTLASRNVGNAILEGPFAIPSTALVQGMNTVAVELHQGTQGADVVFSLSIDQVTTNSSTSNVRNIYEDLRVTEINYHPELNASTEYVQLQNTGDTMLQLQGVTLTGGIEFAFPWLQLAPGESVVVAQDIDGLQAEFGTNVRVAGTYSGRLDNDGDQIVVQLPAPHQISALRFDFNDWWLPSTDGQGDVLRHVEPNAPAALWGQRQSWVASTPDFTPLDIYDLNADGQVGAADFSEMEQAIRAGSTAGVYDLNNNGVVDVADLHRLVIEGLGTLPGDADLNGTVDAIDFGHWRASMFQANKTWASGDFNVDGVVDVADFNIWNENKFSPVARAQSASHRAPRAALSAIAIDQAMAALESLGEGSRSAMSYGTRDLDRDSFTPIDDHDRTLPIVRRTRNELRLRRSVAEDTTNYDTKVVPIQSLPDFAR